MGKVLWVLLPLLILSASLRAEKSCYSIQAEVGEYTPVSSAYTRTERDGKLDKSCTIFDQPTIYDDNRVYIGCFPEREAAKKALESLPAKVKHPKIVQHTPQKGDPYLLIPKAADIRYDEAMERLKKVYEENRPKTLLKRFPSKFTTEGVELVESRKIGFLPMRNLYEFARWVPEGMNRKFLVIYAGDHDLESLRKAVNDPHLIRRVDADTYDLRVPIILGPNASLTIRNKTVHLEGSPRPMAFFYFGRLYFGSSDFLVWDFEKNAYLPRENLSESQLLYLGVERPRPFLIGLAGSHSILVDNRFKGLGYHGTIGPFGLAMVHYPSKTPYVGPSFMMNYFVGTLPNPTGSIVGNDIEEGSMGYYSNEAGNAYLIGNYLHDNVIYNVDPHDYSEELVLARNLSARALHAHGIVISRHVEDTIIAENLLMSNHAGGIMFDRNSNNNAIIGNMSINNGFMGISIQESENGLIADNYLAGNLMDGIIIRNSLRMSLRGNRIEGNGKNGVEVLIKDIDNTSTRDFPRDPYVKATTAVLEENNISDNFGSDIKVKNSAAVQLKKNHVGGDQGLPYGGDLNLFMMQISEAKDGNWTLYGRGFPFLDVSTDLATLSTGAYDLARKIFLEIYDAPNREAALTLTGMYLDRNMTRLATMESARAASNVERKILAFLGYSFLIASRELGWKEKRLTEEGLVFLVESVILDNRFAAREIPQLKYVMPLDAKMIESAFSIAKQRMKRGELFSKEEYRNSVLCRNTLTKRQKVQAALQRFLYRMNDAKEKDFVRFCERETDAMPYLNPVIIGTAKAKYKENNRLKDLPAKQMQELRERAQQDEICQRYLVKQGYMAQEVGDLMETMKAQSIEKWKPELKRYLDMINEFRIRKLTMKDLLSVLERPIADYEIGEGNSTELTPDLFAPMIYEDSHSSLR